MVQETTVMNGRLTQFRPLKPTRGRTPGWISGRGWVMRDKKNVYMGLPLSAHCAPALHVHPGCAAPRLRHLEYFHDHARIERMLFDSVRPPEGGALRPDLSRPGLGLEFKRADAE